MNAKMMKGSKGPQDSALSFLVLNSAAKATAIADSNAAGKIKPEYV